MTATTTGVATAAPVTERTRVGWGDLAWLTWRQHRWTILGTTVVVVGIVALALGIAWHVDATGETHRLFGRWRYLSVGQALVLTPALFGLVVGAFWGAPLVSREHEQRTHLVAWGQDVTATRWLAGKVVLLGVPAVALAAGLGLALITLMNSLNAVSTDYAPFVPFDVPAFEAAPQVQVGYAAFGFALGLAFSATTRRTVLSMGLTVGLFFAVRAAVAAGWRPYFQAPVRVVEEYDEFDRSWSGHDGTWSVNGGFVDTAGNEVPFPDACDEVQGIGEYARCLKETGVRYFVDHHPADRLVPFQLFEFTIFTTLAAGLLALTFLWVRRARRV
ncbi:hypothetical protein [Saccharothrix stipae]